MTVNPPAVAAARLLKDVRRRGYPVASVDDAIRAGALTDTEWCDALTQAWEEAGTLPTAHIILGRYDTRTAIIAALRETPGLTHMDLVFRLDSRPDVVSDALVLLLDRGHVTARRTPQGSKCALAYFLPEESP